MTNKETNHMTNRELAVQLLTANLQMRAVVASNPNYNGIVQIPSYQEMVDCVADLAQRLSRIDDNGATIL